MALAMLAQSLQPCIASAVVQADAAYGDGEPFRRGVRAWGCMTGWASTWPPGCSCCTTTWRPAGRDNTRSVAVMPLPLPPLAEQHRIVAKVDELMALCDRLEAQLTTNATQSRRLLEAVLHEALAGA